MKKVFFLFICFCLLLSLGEKTAMAQLQLVPASILQRVFLIKYGTSIGSSFTLDIDGKQYLITAKHVLNGIKKEDKIEIFHKEKWETLNVKVLFCENPATDIVVMAIPVQLSRTDEVEATSKAMFVSQDVFFLGFPFEMWTYFGELNNYFPLPFIKKGILSATDPRNNQGGIFYVDGNNNPGFSGGPIVFYDLNDHKIKICGVIHGYINQANEIPQTALYAKGNSGILVGFMIDSAIEVIKKNPIGVTVK
ncbi:MAG: trypsin-like peptidase domain-containing protein [Candidatus Omnitrophica bacterium]|nr:trypsin-like peptidase domain-containing protein [Candidatus Omnitrophota bacterium]